jgi:hypothetical protein
MEINVKTETTEKLQSVATAYRAFIGQLNNATEKDDHFIAKNATILKNIEAELNSRGAGK